MSVPETASVPAEQISQAIRIVRGRRALLDSELATLYGVATKRLNEQVRRNLDRFPEDFLFRLSRAEMEAPNRPQNATGSQKTRDPRFRPHAFTERGAIMAARVLNSRRAMEISVYVVRAFVKLRETLSSDKELAAKFVELERKIETHDQAIAGILKAIRQLMNPPDSKRRGIGFTADLDPET